MEGLRVKFVFYIFLSVFIFQCSNLNVNCENIVGDGEEGGFCDTDSCKDEESPQVQSNSASDIVLDEGGVKRSLDEDSMEQGSSNEEINVMITFYNALKNAKLIKTFTTTVESLLQHATVPLAIHIIGEPESQAFASNIIEENNYYAKKYRFVPLDVDKLATELEDVIAPMQQHFSYKPGAYYNHALFFLSIAMHRVMPHLNKVIMLDADLKFVDDIKKLHDRFRLFTKDNIIGIGRDLQPVYRHTFWKYRQENPGTRVGNPPPDGLTGFNSGVLLLDLQKMRESKLYNVLLSPDKLEVLTKEFHFKGHLGDQDFFTLLSMKYEWLFHVLPCTWNRQLCTWWKDHGYKDIFDLYFNCEGDIKIYHGNCGTLIPDV